MRKQTENGKEDLRKAALDFVREYGMEALSAGNLEQRLQTEDLPFLSGYDTVEELRKDVIAAAREYFTHYVKEGLDAKPPFREYGVQCIRFAKEETNLFRLLFMQNGQEKSYEDFIKSDENYEDILNTIKSTFSLQEEQAEILYRNLWIYTHGVAVLVATGMCDLSIGEISDMLVMVCHSFLIGIKAFCNEGKEPDLKKGAVIRVTPTEWVFCPLCGSKTRLKLREDTVLKKYPLLCPKCKQESVIDAEFFHVEVSTEPV